MRQNKFFSAAIALLLIVFFTTSWVTPTPAHSPERITITAVYDYSTFPHVKGTFTTSGAATISGNSTMDIHPSGDGSKAFCQVLLTASDGTITIYQQCNLTASKGVWEIISGTGAYANVKGYGSLTMPPDTELMTGVIF